MEKENIEKTINISLKEYSELIEIKGRYKELKEKDLKKLFEDNQNHIPYID